MPDAEAIYITGHRRPDTDSAASAAAYSRLRGRLDPDKRYVPVLLGEPVPQTRKIFERAGVTLPLVREDLRANAGELMDAGAPFVRDDALFLEALEPLQQGRTDAVAVVDASGKLVGVVSDRLPHHQFIYHLNVEDFVGSHFALEHLVKGLQLRQCGGGIPSGSARNIRVATTQRTGGPFQPGDIVISSGDATVLTEARAIGVHAVILAEADPSRVPGADEHAGPPVYHFAGSFLALVSSLPLCLPVRHVMEEKFETVRAEDGPEKMREVLARVPHSVPVVDGAGKFLGLLPPQRVLGAPRRKLILVDHFEKGQALPEVEAFDVLEILDHHRVGNLETVEPVRVDCRPWGSTASIVAAKYREAGLEPEPSTALILLGALVADTLLLTSPTTTDEDRRIARELADYAKVDLREFGMDVLRWNDELMTGNPATLVTRDLKEFTNTGLCFGLGQIETVDLNQLTPERQEELRRHLEEETKRAGWRFAVLMITDVLKSESLLLAVSGSGPAGWWSDWTPHRKAGLVSRKKQLVPLVLEEIRKGATS